MDNRIYMAVLALAALTAGCQPPENQTMTADSGVRPVLTGRRLPTAYVRSEDGELACMCQTASLKPTVLVFYRGEWCKYCREQLQQLETIRPELEQMGYQIVAISPDMPAKLRETKENLALNFTLLSDSDMEAAKALGIAFRLDDETYDKYKAVYGFDIEQWSGKNHHLLPHPAVYITGPGAVVRFEHVDPDYAERMSNDEVLAEAKKASL